MIKLAKGGAPKVLVDNAQTWTDELLALIRRGEPVPRTVRDRYRHADIKAAVRRDSWDKCIYCESKILHVAHGDIEHIRPKSKFPRLTFEWQNLGLVCTKCNTSKGDSYPQTAPLDPYQDDPSKHLTPVGELVWPKPGNDRAQITESLLKLNRADLVTRRRQRMEVIHRLADSIVRSTNADVRAVLLEQLRNEVADDQEYLMVCRALVRALSAHFDEAAA